MPYGDEFLNALSDMLNDGGATSSRVSQQCQQCHKRIKDNMESQGLGNLIPICDACSHVRLIDFNEPDGTYYLADLMGQRQARQRKIDYEAAEKRSEEWHRQQREKPEHEKNYYMRDGIKIFGKVPRPSRFGNKPITYSTGAYFYDAYGNKQRKPD